MRDHLSTVKMAVIKKIYKKYLPERVQTEGNSPSHADCKLVQPLWRQYGGSLGN